MERLNRDVTEQPDSYSNEEISSSLENTEGTRLFVNENKDEYLSVNSKLARKINKLLESQLQVQDVQDVAKLFDASDKIAGANCHKTALFLTGKISEEELFSPDNHDPETAGHSYIETHSQIVPDTKDLQEIMLEKELPFRISFFKKKEGKNFAYHSITILGTTSKGTVVAFEKEGPYADTPFKYVDATNVIAQYLMRGFTAGLEK